MVHLKIPAEEAIARINERIDDIKNIKSDQNGLLYYEFITWCSKTWQVIDGIYGSDDPHSEELRTLGLMNCSCNSGIRALILSGEYRARLDNYIDEIRESIKNP